MDSVQTHADEVEETSKISMYMKDLGYKVTNGSLKYYKEKT